MPGPSSNHGAAAPCEPQKVQLGTVRSNGGNRCGHFRVPYLLDESLAGWDGLGKRGGSRDDDVGRQSCRFRAATNRAASEPTTIARTVATVPVAAKSAVEPTALQMAADRAKLVEVQIASGEFGPALQTARSASDAVERTHLLKTIADAQLQNGDRQAADMSISRMPIPESRDQARARAQNSSRQSAAGGAAQAAQLVNLIKQTTGDEDEWTEDGQRKQPIYWPPGIEVDPNGGLLRGLMRIEEAVGTGARARWDTALAKPTSTPICGRQARCGSSR